MSLNSKERKVIFYLCVVIACLAVATELFTCGWIILSGKTDLLKTILSSVAGLGTVGFCWKFLSMVAPSFQPKERISDRNLKAYFENRQSCLHGQSAPLAQSEAQRLISLLTLQSLKLVESILRNWIGGYHYELSVFHGSTQPEIVVYYDSGGCVEPRSKPARQHDPDFYEKKGYEVVELLQKPSSEIVYLPDTRAEDANYSFIDASQKCNIKSQIMYCCPGPGPQALVITCSQQGALTKDSDLDLLIRALGTAILSDRCLSDLIHVDGFKSPQSLTAEAN